MNITDPLRRNARLAPDAVAIECPDGSHVSYRELDRAIDCCAARAIDLGLRAGCIVSAQLSDPYAMLTLVLGMARAGVAIASSQLPEAHLSASLVGPGAPGHPSVRNVVVGEQWWNERSERERVAAMPAVRDGNALFRIFMSSGTTGTAKFAAMSHARMAERVYLREFVARLPEKPRLLCSISGGTNIGFGSFLQVLWKLGTVVLIAGHEPLTSVLERQRVNVLVCAPVTLQQLVNSIPAVAGRIGTLDTVIAAGSALSDRLFDVARERMCENIVSLYGSVEAGAIASAPKSVLWGRQGAAGFVLPGIEMQAVDEAQQPVPAGTEGLLRIRGATCIDGYFGDPAASASVFRDGWFYPGDTGSIGADGLLTLGARASDVINSGGNKVSPHVVEEVLMSVPSVRDAAAFGFPDPQGVTRVWAAIATQNNGPPDHATLEAVCRKHLGSTAPVMFLHLPRIPRNENGKILRDELRSIAMRAVQRRASAH